MGLTRKNAQIDILQEMLKENPGILFELECVVTLELVPRIPCPQSTHVIEPPFLRDPDKKDTSLSKI